jgi:microcystin degradation protein MlrC
MRIAIGGISHETNTFCNPTPITDFARLEGETILAANRGVRSYLGGMIDAAERVGATVVPTYSANATPSGGAPAQDFRAMLDRLVASNRSVRPVDAVCLALHGAGAAEGCDDIETVILEAVREAVGPSVPVVATLDLHGNLRPEMLKPATALFGVHLYPHEDSYERGVEAVEFLVRYLQAGGRIRPTMHLERFPLLFSSSSSDEEPVRSVNAFCQELERRPGVIDVTFFHGFSHTDIPDMSASVLAITDGDPELARQLAREVARHVWGRRTEFDRVRPGAEAAVAQAIAAVAEVGGPVVVNDYSDNPGGGGPGDGTHLLRALLAANRPRTAFAFIYDPEVAAQAHAAGTGATIPVRLGGRTYPLHGDPVVGSAYVKCLTDGHFVATTPMGRGRRVSLGKMARLVMGEVDVLVSSVRTQVLDPEVYLLHGIDVTRYDIVALKSANHFRAGFRDLASRILAADTPGWTTGNVRNLPYRRIRRPVWPLDPDAVYPAD